MSVTEKYSSWAFFLCNTMFNSNGRMPKLRELTEVHRTRAVYSKNSRNVGICYWWIRGVIKAHGDPPKTSFISYIFLVIWAMEGGEFIWPELYLYINVLAYSVLFKFQFPLKCGLLDWPTTVYIFVHKGGV